MKLSILYLRDIVLAYGLLEYAVNSIVYIYTRAFLLVRSSFIEKMLLEAMFI